MGLWKDPILFEKACTEAANLVALTELSGVPRALAVSHHPPGLIMTLHSNKTLHQLLLETIPDPTLLEIMKILLMIVRKIHARGYVHNNIKASHVSVDI